jgi:hypothetical protein
MGGLWTLSALAAVSGQHNDVGHSYTRQALGKNRSSVLAVEGAVTSSSSSMSVVTGHMLNNWS